MAKKRKAKTKAGATATDQATTPDDKVETTTTTTTSEDAPASTKMAATSTATTTPATKPSNSNKPGSKSSSVLSSEPIITLIDDLLPPEPGMEDLSTARVLLVGAALLAFGTTGFYYIPGLIQKDMDSTGNHLINAFYCASITLTTVGFGDICPGETDTNGKLFLLLFSLMGLGMFGGPILQLGAAWRHAIPGGVGSVAAFLLGLGVTIFTAVEGLDHFEAVYASIITGTTIGYGDVTPQTDMGKIAVALYALVSVHATAILLDPARLYLEQLCRRRPKRKPQANKKGKQE